MQKHVQVSSPGVRPPGLEGSCSVSPHARGAVLRSTGCPRPLWRPPRVSAVPSAVVRVLLRVFFTLG